MSLSCGWREARLSRFVDGELALPEYRAVQAHLEVCRRCSDRVAAFRALNESLDGSPVIALRRAEPRAAVLAAALAAALIASLAANLLLPAAAPEGAAWAPPERPSEALRVFYAGLGVTVGR